MYAFFIVERYGTSKAETIWFFRAVSTILHSLYIHICSFCSIGRCFYSPGGVHTGTVSVLPSSFRRTKGVLEMRVYCSGGRIIPRYPFCPTFRLIPTDTSFDISSWCISFMAEYLVFPTCLVGEGVGNHSMVTPTNDAVDMISTPTSEVIGTSLVARRRKEIVSR